MKYQVLFGFLKLGQILSCCEILTVDKVSFIDPFVVKLMFQGIDISILIFAHKHTLWVLTRNMCFQVWFHNLCLEQK